MFIDVRVCVRTPRCIEYLNGCLCPLWLTQGHLFSSTEAAASVLWLRLGAIRPVLPFSATRWRCGCVGNACEAISLVFKFFHPHLFWDLLVSSRLRCVPSSSHPVAQLWIRDLGERFIFFFFHCSRGRLTVFQADRISIYGRLDCSSFFWLCFVSKYRTLAVFYINFWFNVAIKQHSSNIDQT